MDTIFYIFLYITKLLVDSLFCSVAPCEVHDNFYDASFVEWVTAIGTMGTAIIALVVIFWEKNLKQLFIKPDIVLTEWVGNEQEKQGHTRLIFENRGKDFAEDVEVYISNIIEEGKPRINFLPVPLNWTHWSYLPRIIHQHQFRYLDLCRIDNVDDENCKPKLALSAGQNVPAYESINEGLTELEITLFQKSGQVIMRKVLLEWYKGDRFVKAKIL